MECEHLFLFATFAQIDGPEGERWTIGKLMDWGWHRFIVPRGPKLRTIGRVNWPMGAMEGKCGRDEFLGREIEPDCRNIFAPFMGIEGRPLDGGDTYLGGEESFPLNGRNMGVLVGMRSCVPPIGCANQPIDLHCFSIFSSMDGFTVTKLMDPGIGGGQIEWKLEEECEWWSLVLGRFWIDGWNQILKWSKLTHFFVDHQNLYAWELEMLEKAHGWVGFIQV